MSDPPLPAVVNQPNLRPFVDHARRQASELASAALDGLAVVRFAGAALVCLLIGAATLGGTSSRRS